MLSELTLIAYLEKTASKDPAPGGGSAAALGAATAAGLCEMVAHVTEGKPGYEAVQPEMGKMAEEARKLRARLVTAIDRDTEAFNGVLAAYKLANRSEQEKAVRRQAIQGAIKTACEVPLQVADDAFKVLMLAATAVERGNKNAVTDAAVAAMMSRTAVLSALYNVKINLKALTDDGFRRNVESRVKALEAETHQMEKKILSMIAL